jgi:hypothetical protein
MALTLNSHCGRPGFILRKDRTPSSFVILGGFLIRKLGADMNDKLLIMILAAMLPSLSFAQGPQNYQCTYGDLQRRVEILYETGMTLPCEVHYYKDTEAPGERQVLWRAMNESGYCEQKAQEFVAKFEESGWTCSQNDDAGKKVEPAQTNDSEQGAEPESADDTEALVPGEETESTEDT